MCTVSRLSEDRLLLRAVEPADLDRFFAQQRDRAARHMAAFTSRDGDDRVAFDAHWARISVTPGAVNRAIVVGAEVVGHVASFEQGGEREVSYWIDRAHWGRGIATRALRRFIAELPRRPLHARAAADNAASIRVLTNCGFVPCGTDRGFAAARGAEIDELLLRLDA